MFNRILTFLLVSFLWSFFIWPGTRTAFAMMGSVFTAWSLPNLGSLGLNLGEGLVLAAGSILLWLADLFRQTIRDRFARLSPAGRLAVIGGLGLLVLTFGMYGIGFRAEEFIYSRF